MAEVITVTAADRHVEQIFDVLRRMTKAFHAGGVPYRVVGGLAVFLHVDQKDPLKARFTRDVDVAVARSDLEVVKKAAETEGFSFRHVAGIDMLVDAEKPRVRSAIHLVFVGEKVRPEHVEAAPDFSEPVNSIEGTLVAPVADLVRMKLTSFRLRDQVHIQDMDSVELITPEIENALSETLLRRLDQVRRSE